MKAVVLEEQGVINVREVPDAPALGLGELKIAPHTVGVCGSDLHYYTHGRVGKYVVKQPMILGHEASGTVVEVGPGVEGFKVGDRVAMEPGIPDMSSRASKLGMYNVDPAVRFFATPPIDGCLPISKKKGLFTICRLRLQFLYCSIRLRATSPTAHSSASFRFREKSEESTEFCPW